MKRTLLGFGLGAVIFTAILGGYTVKSIEDHLRARGLQWTDRSLSLTGLQWKKIVGPGLSISQLVVRPNWPVIVHLEQVIVEPAALEKQSNNTESATLGTPAKVGASTSIPVQVEAHDLAISWAGKEWLQGLSGQLYPTISLSRGADHFKATANAEHSGHWAGHATMQLPWEHLSGDAQIEFELRDFLELRVSSDAAIISHPFIANTALPPQRMTARVVWKPETGELAAEGQLGEVQWDAVGSTDTEKHDIQVRVPLTPLGKVVNLFGEQVPEAAGANLEGGLGLSAHIQGPPWKGTFEPAAQDLAVSDALPEEFGGNRIRWMRNGIAHETGPAVKGWVGLHQAGWLSEAAIAAEDIRFRTHPGFDLIAIQEALDASVGEERMRGGSTITQQLAKNLFLDGRRTLLRKLRELILALNMESRMSKDAILALYLNVVEFGPGIHGISEAANAWFLKDPAQLTAREAAFLTSILPAPQMWHKRISQTQRVPISRVNEVLNRMRRRGILSARQHKRAIQEKLRVVPP